MMCGWAEALSSEILDMMDEVIGSDSYANGYIYALQNVYKLINERGKEVDYGKKSKEPCKVDR